MGFDTNGNGYLEHEGMHDNVYRPPNFPVIDTTATYKEVYMKAKLIRASLDDIRAIVREEIRSALAEKQEESL